MAGPSRFKRWMDGLSTALLKRARPALLKWLRERVGDEVEVRELVVEGKRIHVRDALLPIGPVARLRIDHATFEARLETMTTKAPPLSLESLEGLFFVPRQSTDGDGDDADAPPTFAAPVRFECVPLSSHDEWVAGKVHVTSAFWDEYAGQDEQAPIVGDMSIVVTADRWSVEGGRATAGEATLTLVASGRLDDADRAVEEVELGAERARVGHFVDGLVALTGRAGVERLPLPRRGRVTGRCGLAEGSRVYASFALTTEGGRLDLDLEGDRERAKEGRFVGRIAAEELLPHERLGAFTDDAIGVDASFSGPWEGLEGELSLGHGGREAHARFDAASRVLTLGDLAPEAVALLAAAAGVDHILGVAPPGEPPATSFALPTDATVDARLTLGAAIEGEVRVKTPRSDVALTPLRVARETLDFTGSRITGTLEASDAVAAGLFPRSVEPVAGSATLDLALLGRREETRVDGVLESESLTFSFLRRAPVELVDARSRLRVDGEAVELGGLAGELLDGAIAMDLRIAYPVDGVFYTPTGRLTLTGLKSGVRTWLRELTGISRLPMCLTLDSDLVSDDQGTLTGPISLSTPESRLVLDLRLGPRGHLAGSALHGILTLGDLYELFPTEPMVVTGRGAISVDAAVEGELTDPRAPRFTLKSDEAVLLLARPGMDVRAPLRAVEISGHVDARRLVVESLGAEVWSGRLDAEGSLDFERGGALSANVRVEGSSIASLPVEKLAAQVGGRLGGSFVVEREAAEPFTVRGDVRLDEPRYPGLRAAAPSLARYGLAAPDTAGTSPLSAEVTVDDGVVTFGEIRGATSNGRVEAEARIADGRLSTDGMVTVSESYLRTSTLLSIPAAVVGDVKVPFVVRGPLSAPRFRADLVGTLGQLFSGSVLEGGIRAVGDALDDFFGSPARPPTRRSPRASSEPSSRRAASDDTQKIIDRLADGRGDYDAQLDVLLERGLSPDEIAERIEEAREARLKRR